MYLDDIVVKQVVENPTKRARQVADNLVEHTKFNGDGAVDMEVSIPLIVLNQFTLLGGEG